MWNFQGTNRFLRGGFDPHIIDIFLKDNIDGVEIHEEADFIDIKIRKIKG